MDDETAYEREKAEEALARGAKRCPARGCPGGVLVHYAGHGRHDVTCSACGAQVCFLCTAVWLPYHPRCPCPNECAMGVCTACPACQDCVQAGGPCTKLLLQ